MIATNECQQPELAVDPALIDAVRTGLAQMPKRIPSRFFYDAEGSRLFEQIMELPEYYLTRSEYEVLDQYKDELLQQFSAQNQPFDLIELGAGDGYKTKVLLDQFVRRNAQFTYAPIDISADALDQLTADLQRIWPDLQLAPQHTDYFDALERLADNSANRKVILFLGSNVGNFSPEEAISFYEQLSRRLQPGDIILTGFDLQKHPAVISAAYNDQQGVTRAFNLNLLRRLNRELDADFDLNYFDHYEIYNPETGEARSYLVSDVTQTVHIRRLDMTVTFAEGEIIHTEISRKFTRAQIEQLAEETGFEVVGWFMDSKRYFADVLYQKV